MARRDSWFDALVLVAAVALVAVTVLGPPDNAAYSPAGIVIECATLALLPFRRVAPQVVGWLVAAAALAMTFVELTAPGTLVSTDLTPWVPLAVTPFVAYGLTAFASDRRTAWATVAILAVVAARPWEPTGQGITQALLLTAVPALLGMYVSARRLLLEQALVEQRAGLAADLHDTITHRISLIVLRAGVLGLSTHDEAVRVAAEELRATGCLALDELQELLYVLRDRTDAPASIGMVPHASVPELSSLLADCRTSGVDAELVEDGEPDTTPPVIRRTVHRIVQESLTNVGKHAPGAGTRVHVRYRDDGVRVTVRNGQPTRKADPALAGTGARAGLHNLRQRVEMIGGTLHAGPEAGGGFRVDATLPMALS